MTPGPVAPTSLQLRGTECTALDEVRSCGHGPVGIAMSCGRLPKPHPSLDPNEDAATAVVGSRGVVAAVCDGHRGADAALTVLDVVLGRGPMLVDRPLADPGGALRSTFEEARTALGARLAGAEGPRRASRTAVTVAVVTGGRCTVATVGDTAAWLQRRHRLVRFRGSDDFLGPEQVRPVVGSRPVRPGDRLVLASDGLEHFTRPATILAGLRSTTGGPAEEAARALVRAALLGGAGDNVTVVAVDLAELTTADGRRSSLRRWR